VSGPGDPAIVSLGLRVRDLRLALDWSQEHLAELADLHRNYVGAVERAELNPSFGNVVRLATALGTTVCGLYPDDGSHLDSHAR
jgi:transcriptional regulator with XRE-family HTH domain